MQETIAMILIWVMDLFGVKFEAAALMMTLVVAIVLAVVILVACVGIRSLFISKEAKMEVERETNEPATVGVTRNRRPEPAAYPYHRDELPVDGGRR